MRIGIGIPNTMPGISGQTLLAWAQRAEARGFSTLATIDRIMFPNYDSLITLTAAAAVTQRIGLLTNVLLGPTRATPLLAKSAASLDQISGGRFILGLGVGGREDDYEAVGVDFHQRGRIFDAQLEALQVAWSGAPQGANGKASTPRPTHDGGVPILIGGSTDAAIARAVKYGVGWTAGGASPEQSAPFVARLREAWEAAGREGQPRVVALCYFALGPQAEAAIHAYIDDYYGFLPWAAQMAASLPRSREDLQSFIGRFEAAGYDEVIFDPTSGDLAQVDLLADAVLPGQ
jgi:alkanesulfonate monooxygenase SsuD/methylene tetrahydromethanopterin reductase-like flavin-dependent oxidoreductase (luciferase family)